MSQGLEARTAEAVAGLRSALIAGQGVGDALRRGFAWNSAFFTALFGAAVMRSFGVEPDAPIVTAFAERMFEHRSPDQLGFTAGEVEAVIHGTVGDWDQAAVAAQVVITSPAIAVAVMESIFAMSPPSPQQFDELVAMTASSQADTRARAPEHLDGRQGHQALASDRQKQETELLINSARLCIQTDDLTAALTHYDRAVGLDPANTTALTERGSLQNVLGRPAAALADFERAIRLEPANAAAIEGRGDVWRTTGQYDDALADYDHVVALGSANAWTFVLRAETLRLLERYEEALADAMRAVDLDPDNPLTLTERADVYKDMGRYEDAIADYDRTFDMCPAEGEQLASRAAALQALGRFEDALGDYSRAIELNPDEAWMLVSRGELYEEMGRHADARADFARAVELEPEYAAELDRYRPGGE